MSLQAVRPVNHMVAAGRGPLLPCSSSEATPAPQAPLRPTITGPQLLRRLQPVRVMLRCGCLSGQTTQQHCSSTQLQHTAVSAGQPCACTCAAACESLDAILAWLISAESTAGGIQFEVQLLFEELQLDRTSPGATNSVSTESAPQSGCGNPVDGEAISPFKYAAVPHAEPQPESRQSQQPNLRVVRRLCRHKINYRDFSLPQLFFLLEHRIPAVQRKALSALAKWTSEAETDSTRMAWKLRVVPILVSVLRSSSDRCVLACALLVLDNLLVDEPDSAEDMLSEGATTAAVFALGHSDRVVQFRAAGLLERLADVSVTCAAAVADAGAVEPAVALLQIADPQHHVDLRDVLLGLLWTISSQEEGDYRRAIVRAGAAMPLQQLLCSQDREDQFLAAVVVHNLALTHGCRHALRKAGVLTSLEGLLGDASGAAASTVALARAAIENLV